MLEGLVAYTLAFVECLFSHSALLLQLVLVLTALHDVTRSHFHGVEQPLEKFGEWNRVLLNLLRCLFVLAE